MDRRIDALADSALIALAHNDREAIRVLYRRYFPRLYAYVAGRVRQPQDAEDIVADTFLQVVAALDRFVPRAEHSFAAWVFQIAHNRVHDYYRQQSRQPGAVPLSTAMELADTSPLPGEHVLRGETCAELQRLLADLAPRSQDVIALKFFAGLRNREIAQVLSLDERTVGAYLARALQTLRRIYAAQHADRQKETVE